MCSMPCMAYCYFLANLQRKWQPTWGCCSSLQSVGVSFAGIHNMSCLSCPLQRVSTSLRSPCTRYGPNEPAWVLIHDSYTFMQRSRPYIRVIWLKNLQYRLPHLQAGVFRLVNPTFILIIYQSNVCLHFIIHIKTCGWLWYLLLQFLMMVGEEVLFAGARSILQQHIMIPHHPRIQRY